jgi:iron complex transport system permease protein
VLGLLLVSALAWGAACQLALLVGSTSIGFPSPEVRALRLSNHIYPASLIGAALAAAGAAYQSILRNPLADPYLLGASSGAMLASYLWRSAVLGTFAVVGAFSSHAFALFGAMAATAVVLGLAGRRGRVEPVTAILVGVIINSLCGAAFLLLNSIFKESPGSGGAMAFLVGDIQTTASPTYLKITAITVGIAWIALLLMTPALNVIRLSEDEASSLGVRVQRTRWAGLLVASLMTACAVAISGPIGFVGLICPHIARWFCGNDNRRMLPVATAIGAAMLVLADALARLLLGKAGTLIPVGVITSIVGGPFFLLILLRMRRA